ncbi:MAG: hypothetical protein GX640_17280 [Fibrobacter sp.]|nr:hypothetical protein [Fibrobacter sp.]
MKIVFITGAEISEVECNWPVIPRIGEMVKILGESYTVTNVCYNSSCEIPSGDLFELHKILVYLKSV